MHVNRSERTLWSFLMSSAHGAGLMVAPVLICARELGGAQDHTLSDMSLGSLSIPQSALAVCETVGVSVLRKASINLDHLGAGAFVAAGLITFFT
jgi:hypothetical protein